MNEDLVFVADIQAVDNNVNGSSLIPKYQIDDQRSGQWPMERLTTIALNIFQFPLSALTCSSFRWQNYRLTYRAIVLAIKWVNKWERCISILLSFDEYIYLKDEYFVNKFYHWNILWFAWTMFDYSMKNTLVLCYCKTGTNKIKTLSATKRETDSERTRARRTDVRYRFIV